MSMVGKMHRICYRGLWQDAVLWDSPWGSGATRKYWSTPDTDQGRGIFICFYGETDKVKPS